MKFHKIIMFLFLVAFIASCAPGAPSPASTFIQTQKSTNTLAPLSPKNSIEINFDPVQQENGISLLKKDGDNQYSSVSIQKKNAISTDGFKSHILTNFISFQISDSFYATQEPITFKIEYFDKGDGLIYLQYDSYSSTTRSEDPTYRTIDLAFRQNTLKWKSASYVISDARFDHLQNLGGDFRINGEINPVIISDIKIIRGGEPPSTATPLPTTVSPAAYPIPLTNKAVFTYYFYWYDAPNGWAFNLTDAPVDFQTMSWLDVSWHLKQLREIKKAGIDVVLPVIDYSPGKINYWQPGLIKLAAALDEMLNGGTTPPSVGMFVDTSSFQGKDLREESTKEELYGNVKYFFTTIPQGYWALAENNRPIVWFYTANWPTAFDQTFIDFIYQHFQEDFGVRPYLVFDNSWQYPVETRDGGQVKNFNSPRLKYDATYSWGGAIVPNFSLQIAEIGPGYDDHAVEDRIPPIYTDRRNGETYKQNFALAIKCGSPWLVFETWSEFMEGTEIAETLQYGRQYLDLTKEYISYFKEGRLPQGFSLGKYSSENEISFSAGNPNLENGISLGPNIDDGIYQTESKVGNQSFKINGGEGSYLYFSVDDSFYLNEQQPIQLTIRYFDEGFGSIYLDYDTATCGADFNPNTMYKRIGIAYLNNSLSWKFVTITLNDASFANNENNRSDFRLTTSGPPLNISTVEIKKIH